MVLIRRLATRMFLQGQFRDGPRRPQRALMHQSGQLFFYGSRLQTASGLQVMGLSFGQRLRDRCEQRPTLRRPNHLVVVAVEVVVRQVQQAPLVVEVLDVEPIDQELQELQVKVIVEEKVDG